MKPETTEETTRRDFLKTGAAAGAGAAAAVLLPGVAGAAESSVPQAETKPTKQGYRASEHVRAYYRSARI